MYIGSVRFFKHLILSVIALLILVPTVGCVYLAFQYRDLSIVNMEQAELIQTLSESDDDNSDISGDKETAGDNPAFTVYASDRQPDSTGKALPYQLKYPHLYVENDFQYIAEADNTIYLTFDDGPTALTPQVLDILREQGVSATFFVVYKDNDEARALYRRIADEGHTLAVHSATHDYRIIYRSVEAFLDDFATLSDMLYEVTGTKPELFRFPGGSINNYNKEIHAELVAEMLRRGYTYYDWDVSSGSSTNTATSDSIYANVLNGVSGKNRAVVLMHDAGTSATVSALPGIIESLKASGYKFEALDKHVRPPCFDYSN